MTEPQIETRLPIRVRRTIDANGEITAAMLVYCESRRRSVSLDDCANCDQCESVHIDPLEDDSWLICRRGGFPSIDALGEAGADRIPVVNIMSSRVVCVAPETQIGVVRELLLERGLTGAPVVDAGGTVVGFVSRADLLRERWPAAPPAVVSEVMTALAVTVSETASIAEACALMALEGVHRLPVVDNAAAGKVVGVVSALDVLRWFARRAGYLRQGAPGSN